MGVRITSLSRCTHLTIFIATPRRQNLSSPGDETRRLNVRGSGGSYRSPHSSTHRYYVWSRTISRRTHRRPTPVRLPIENDVTERRYQLPVCGFARKNGAEPPQSPPPFGICRCGAWLLLARETIPCVCTVTKRFPCGGCRTSVSSFIPVFLCMRRRHVIYIIIPSRWKLRWELKGK